MNFSCRAGIPRACSQRILLKLARSSSSSSSSSSSTPANSASPWTPIPRQFKHHLNYRYLRENVDSIEQNARNRGAVNVDVRHSLKLYDQFTSTSLRISELRKKRNEIALETSQLVAALKTVKDRSEKERLNSRKQALIDEGRELKAILSEEELAIAKLEEELYEEARHIPNQTDPSVPIGDESKSITVDMVGSRRLQQDVDHPLRDHVELAKLHNLADFDRAGKVSGTGFYFLKNAGVLLESALTRYALDICISKGFQPVMVPDIVRHEVIEACGFNPKSKDPQTYFLETHLDEPRGKGYDPMRLCLAATAEFPLAAMHANEVFLRSALPLKLVGIGRAYRAEGLSGAINRGLYRVHQFSKVEMFGLTDKDSSAEMLEEFREIQKSIFEGLELCFRVLNMSSEELGAPAYKKYDMEAWMPARNSWGEISSTSNCTDYQSRRFNIRYFDRNVSPGQTNTHSTDFVHTVNGTAAAIPRLIISILETHQLANGDIIIPFKLRKYLFGEDVDRIRVGEGMRQVQRDQ
ncbi:hypothetical protein HDU97_002197 [Phlyctochytrium planicorne]|nr:hypothetical protein HDU97_002197 [Phlyctochytrium planicorne]